MLDKIPRELFLKICQYLKDPEDIRNLAFTTKQNYIFVKKYFIKKEKWLKLSIKNNRFIIKNAVRKGLRYIYFNNKFQYIYNITGSEENIQVITQYELISSTEMRIPIKYNYINLLIEAPYNMKRKVLEI